MSLINQMLKDLEDRRSTEHGGRAELLTRQRHSMLPWIFAGAFGIAAIVMATILLLQQDPSPVPEQTADPASEQTIVAQASQATEPDLQPAVARDIESEVVAVPVEENAPSSVEQPPVNVAQAETAIPARPTPEVRKPVERTASESPAQETPPSSAEEGAFSIAPTQLSPEEQARASMQRGYNAMQARDFRRATNEFSAGLAITPDDDDARLALYQALRRQGRVAEAEGVLENGLIDARETHRFAAMLARMYVARGQVDQAAKLMKASPPAVSQDPEYFVLWGALLQQAGKYDEALTIYADLVSLDPANAQWVAGLGIAQQQTGDTDAAVANYRKALEIGGLAPAVESYISGQLEELAPEED